MEVSDKVNLEFTISDLIELAGAFEATEEGDHYFSFIYEATPQHIRDFIVEELRGTKA